MARFFSNANPVSALIANEVSAVLTRRGFASVTQAAASSTARNGSPAVMLKKSEESAKTSWVPDPVTGYYRPDNQIKELDPAELREILVNNKTRGH